MRSHVRKFAHVLERIGLAMAGAASGLFVAAHVGSSIAALTSQGFVAIMMTGGAIGFYLGIDTPQLHFHGPDREHSYGGSGAKVDTTEFLSAVGTFLAALTASISLMLIFGEPNCRDIRYGQIGLCVVVASLGLWLGMMFLPGKAKARTAGIRCPTMFATTWSA